MTLDRILTRHVTVVALDRLDRLHRQFAEPLATPCSLSAEVLAEWLTGFHEPGLGGALGGWLAVLVIQREGGGLQERLVLGII